MWRCTRCQEEVEDTFDACWNCGRPRDGVEAPSTGSPLAEEAPDDLSGATRRRDCSACEAPLTYRDVVPIRVGGPEGRDDGWSLFAAPDQIDQRLWKVEVWSCPSCRRLELFEPDPE